jgi:hypothetical protein
MSDLPPVVTELRISREVRFVPEAAMQRAALNEEAANCGGL